jgi:hypothetical protein
MGVRRMVRPLWIILWSAVVLALVVPAVRADAGAQGVAVSPAVQAVDHAPKSDASSPRKEVGYVGGEGGAQARRENVGDVVTVWSLILTIVALGGSAAIYPMVFYVRQVWKSRRTTIFETLGGAAKASYLKLYHPSEAKNLNDPEVVEKDFNAMYDRWFGRSRLLIPTWISSAIIVAYLFLCAIKAAKTLFPHTPAAQDIPLDIDLVAVASMAGAYVLVTMDTIARVTRRDLLPEDLYLTTLRLAGCVPLGYAFGSLVSGSGTAPFIALALTAFPLQQLAAFLRQIGAARLGVTVVVAPVSADVPSQLAGVEQTVCDRLAAIGVNTISQVAYSDPVQLTMRTSLNFIYVLDVVSQALAWIYIEQKLVTIRPMGLRGAFEMKSLDDDVKKGDAVAVALMGELPGVLGMTAAQTRNMLSEVVADPRVLFLQEAFG